MDLYYLVKVVLYDGDDIDARNKENISYIKRMMKKRYGKNTKVVDIGVRKREEDTLTVTIGRER